jgi:membrane-associated protease RseP (regulator of RpoE activity)
MPNGSQVKSPAFKAGIFPNDRILSIYGYRIKKFDEIVQFIALGNKKDSHNKSLSTVELERDGKKLQLIVNPVLISDFKGVNDAFRIIGIYPKQILIIDKFVHSTESQGPVLEKGGRIISANGVPLFHV